MTAFRLRTAALSFALIALATSTTRADSAPALTELPLGAVKPAGWLKEQLRLQADGLGGHLDEFWPDIKNSAWIGGKAEGWERTPYWLDGAVPLAYLLDDPALKAKVKRFIDYIIEHQSTDGWLGPVGDNDKNHKPYDVWPLFVLFKALSQYEEATGDPRVVPAMLKACKTIDEVTTKEPLYSWAKFRGGDLLVSLHWLHAKTRDKSLLALADKIGKQSYDWRAHFEHFDKYREKSTRFDMENHGVNNGMGLKLPGLRSLWSGDQKDRNAIFPMLDTLDQYHGQATGVFTCDEHYAGRSPSQGTELCTVAETMYSLELVGAITGDPRLGDRLEKLAFNALPATFKKDMCAHQYDQQANQVVVKVSNPHIYVSNGDDANLYGLEPNFGCCTANMHQGWPKFPTHLWAASVDGGLAALAYAPNVLETKVDGKSVKIETKTDYPFSNVLTFHVQTNAPATFPLRLRIPGWCQAPEVEVKGRNFGISITAAGAAGRGVATTDEMKVSFREPGSCVMTGEWDGATTIQLRLPMPVSLYRGYHDSVAVERGPLVYALMIGTAWKKLRGKEPFADWEVSPTTPWNYALQIDREHPETSVRIETGPVGPRPFSQDSAPVSIKVKGRRLPSWTIEKNAAAPPPKSPVASDEPLEELTLIPYGCTDLRVTEFPTLTP